jgi:hypothetical protein
MPSREHQWLVLWAARKMVQDGYIVVGLDGQVPRGEGMRRLPQPPVVAGVRPDVWGYDPHTGEVALGEAKSLDDVDNAHTRAQLRAFAATLSRVTGTPCRMYLAVPRSASRRLERVLGCAGLLKTKRIVQLPIPDCMLEREPGNELA